MELVALKYGYRLSIGGHDVFLRKEDVGELHRKTGGVLATEMAESSGTLASQASEGETSPLRVVYISQKLLKTMNLGQELKVVVPLYAVRAMQSALHNFYKKYGVRFRAKVLHRKRPSEEFSHKSREYVITRLG